MSDASENHDFCGNGVGNGPSNRPKTMGEVAVNLAVSESLANHGHHALVNAHEAAAGNHQLMAEAGVGDIEDDTIGTQGHARGDGGHVREDTAALFRPTRLSRRASMSSNRGS
jgi:hypothetical protein